MVITKSFNLDINTPWKAPTLYIKQGDVDSRKLQATIRKDGTNYSIPGDVFATFRMHKPDDMFVTQDCTISGSVVSVVMDAQCATAAGHGKAEFVLQTASEVVSTFDLAIEILPSAVTDGDIESRDALGEYRTILEEMLRVKGAPLVANTAADMTDTDRVYVYTGSEVGYVNGDWYYYDGDSWEVGGVYNSQAIGLAYQQEIAQMVKQSAVASESDSTPYLFRPTPNPSAILADEEIVGGTIAWNQLIPKTASTGINNGITFTNNGDGTWTLTGTASTNNCFLNLNYVNGQNNMPLYVNHKYYLPKANTSALSIGTRVYGIHSDDTFDTYTSENGDTIFECAPGAVTTYARLQVQSANGTDIGTVKVTPMCSDLTAMFGSTIADYLYTLESTTPGMGVAKLREWGFLSKVYSPYNAGELVSVNTEGKEVVGKNLINYIKSRSSNGITFAYDDRTGAVTINGTATSNAYSDGTISEALASAYFYALPGTYHAHLFGAENISPYPRFYIQAWYDDGTSEILVNSLADASFTITKSAWIYPRMQVLNGSTMNNVVVYPQIEIGSIATSYVPHRDTIYHTTPTDLNGLFKLDANNQLYADGDVYNPDGTITRNFGYIDLGDCTWYKFAGTFPSLYYTNTLNSEIGSTKGMRIHGICDKYLMITNDDHTGAYGAPDAQPNMTMRFRASDGRVYVVDNSFNDTSDTAAVEAGMAGVKLVYEKATATTDTADTYPATQISAKGGTERRIDNRAVPVPVGHRTTYYIGVPDVPSNANNATLKATVSGGKTTLSWS